MNTIHDLIEQIKQLEKKLSAEMQKKEEEFFYKIQGKKVYFEARAKRYHKTLVTNIYRYLVNASLVNIFLAPLVWSCLFPALFMDFVISVFQFVCFPLYGIPKVDRKEYIVIDRHALTYLNFIEKMNCVYCGYFNGLIAYVQEIAARTEQYWCPIKHAHRMAHLHSRYKKFADYGDGDIYIKKVENIRRDFTDLR